MIDSCLITTTLNLVLILRLSPKATDVLDIQIDFDGALLYNSGTNVLFLHDSLNGSCGDHNFGWLITKVKQHHLIGCVFVLEANL